MTDLRIPALIAALALAGCGDNKTAEPAATTTTADTAAPAGSAPVAAPPAAPPAAATGGTAPAAATPAAGVSYASLTGDAAHGEKVFGQCRVCHAAEPGVNKVGPSLAGVVGRKAASVAGYNYSAANRNSGFVWTEEQLFTYLEAPQKVMPGTKMAYPGLKNPQDRADVIAWLKTRS